MRQQVTSKQFTSKDKTADDADLQAYLASSSDEEGTENYPPFYNPLCMMVGGNLAVTKLFGLTLKAPRKKCI